MIKYEEGNVLDAPRGIIVHGCNCQGVMGSGVAAAVRSRYPGAYELYVKNHKESGLKLGDVQLYQTPENKEKYIANAMTQEFYGNDRRYVNYEAIAESFELIGQILVRAAENGSYDFSLPLYFPQIGAGLARGNWDIISTIIDKTVPDSIEKICVLFKP